MKPATILDVGSSKVVCLCGSMVDKDGIVVSQSPEAGSMLEERSPVYVKAEASDVWRDATSAEDAAQGAKLGSFQVEDKVTLGDLTFEKPKFSCSVALPPQKSESCSCISGVIW